VADAGYDSATNHAALEASWVEGVIAPHGDYDAFWKADEQGELAGRYKTAQPSLIRLDSLRSL